MIIVALDYKICFYFLNNILLNSNNFRKFRITLFFILDNKKCRHNLYILTEDVPIYIIIIILSTASYFNTTTIISN